MQTSSVDIETRDGVSDSYLVRPDGDGPFPPVLLFQDAFGMRPRLAEMAGRIAERGYTVLVPNLLYRFGRSPQIDLSGLADPARRGEAIGQVMPMVHDLTSDKIISDAKSYLDHLGPEPAVLVGYCMGGTNALVVAAAYPERVKAIAGFHSGGVVTDQPDSPHLAVGSITGEVYLGHADNDGSMTAEHIKIVEAALAEAGVTHTSELYEGAPHGFTMTDTAMYHEEGEKRHWNRLFALLDRTRA
jgi:carboxymethylenebutenolidase